MCLFNDYRVRAFLPTVFATAILFLATWTTFDGARAAEPKVEITSLTMVHKSRKLGTIAISPDSSRIVLTTSPRLRSDSADIEIWLNGSKSRATDFLLDSIVFSNDSTQVAFATLENGKMRYCVNGEALPNGYSSVGFFAFSPNGNDFVYSATTEGGAVVVDKKGKTTSSPYDQIHSVTYAADGSRVAYMGYDQDSRTATLVVGNKAIADGFDRYAKKLRLGSSKAAIELRRGDKAFLYDGATLLGPFKEIPYAAVSKDGNHAIYAVGDGASQTAFVDGKKVGTFDTIKEFLWSEHQSKAFITAVKGDRMLAMIDDQIVGEGRQIVGFGPAGKDSYAFAVAGYEKDDADQWRVVVKGKTVHQGQVGVIGTLTTSANGKSSACLRFDPQAKRCTYWVNGKGGPPYEDVTSIQFSEDGTRYVYGAWHDNEYHIVTESGKHGPFDSNGSPPELSRDGAHFSFFGTKGNKRGLVVDGNVVIEAVNLLSVGGSPRFKSAKELNAVVLLSEDGVWSNIGQAKVTW